MGSFNILVNNTITKAFHTFKRNLYNNETFANYYLPETKLRDKIVATPNVDLRDGFSSVLYVSDYVMTVTPEQYHLGKENQLVVGIIYDTIENESPINDNYDLIAEYDIEYGDVKIRIYEKIREYDIKDKEYLKDEFNKYYSKYPELFENRIMQSW